MKNLLNFLGILLAIIIFLFAINLTIFSVLDTELNTGPRFLFLFIAIAVIYLISQTIFKDY